MKNIKILGSSLLTGINSDLKSEGEKRTTIYDIINRFEYGKNASLYNSKKNDQLEVRIKKCLKGVDQAISRKKLGV